MWLCKRLKAPSLYYQFWQKNQQSMEACDIETINIALIYNPFSTLSQEEWCTKDERNNYARENLRRTSWKY